MSFNICAQPEVLQSICDSLGPAQVQAFFDRWITELPTPFTAADRAAGYWWELSMRQVEVSRTLVFDDPRRARSFFEALVADNIAIGRPEQIAIVFARQLRKTTQGPFRTRVFTTGTDVKLDFSYKHSRVKQYLKDGRALRIETVINKPKDLDLPSRLQHLPTLVARARAINQRLLMIERAGQSCAIGSALFERIHQPYNHEGQRTGALRFGDSRAMALAGALHILLHAVTGFTNKSLRGHVAGLLVLRLSSFPRSAISLRHLFRRGRISASGQSGPRRSMSGPSQDAKRNGRRKRVLSAQEKYQIWQQLLTGELSQRQAAEQWNVDPTTIMRIRRVGREGALSALGQSRPGVRAGAGGVQDAELAVARAEIARLEETVKEQAIELVALRGKTRSGW